MNTEFKKEIKLGIELIAIICFVFTQMIIINNVLYETLDKMINSNVSEFFVMTTMISFAIGKCYLIIKICGTFNNIKSITKKKEVNIYGDSK